MRTLRGPSLHLAQFADDAAPFNSLPSIAQWAAGVGFKALQIPAWDGRLFDVETAAESQAYCDDMKGMLAEHGLEISERPHTSSGNWSPCIRRTTPCATTSRRKRCAVIRRAHCVGAGSPSSWRRGLHAAWG